MIPPVLERTGPLWGMIHCLPTPGSPGAVPVDEARERALRDAEALLEAGFDGLILENMHDFPPIPEREMGPEVAASMTALAVALRAAVGPDKGLGVQVLFAAHQVALAVAHAAGCDLIRAEAWTYGHLSDKGWAEASAGRALRYARAIGADQVEIWADVQKKHASHAVTADLELEDILATLPLHGAHAAILTGSRTGVAPDPEELRRARKSSGLPIVLGSGLMRQNAPRLAPLADAFIVGTELKEEGDWRRPVDPTRARALAEAVRAAL